MRSDPHDPRITLADTDELEVKDNLGFDAAFNNASSVPKEYPHASIATNVGKYFWRAALQYERNRTEEETS